MGDNTPAHRVAHIHIELGYIGHVVTELAETAAEVMAANRALGEFDLAGAKVAEGDLREAVAQLLKASRALHYEHVGKYAEARREEEEEYRRACAAGEIAMPGIEAEDMPS